MTFWHLPALFIVAAAWALYEALVAPEGWEDADGFHTGPMPPQIADGEGVDFKRAYQPGNRLANRDGPGLDPFHHAPELDQ
jgi:hypothetical protein